MQNQTGAPNDQQTDREVQRGRGLRLTANLPLLSSLKEQALSEDIDLALLLLETYAS